MVVEHIYHDNNSNQPNNSNDKISNPPRSLSYPHVLTATHNTHTYTRAHSVVPRLNHLSRPSIYIPSAASTVFYQLLTYWHNFLSVVEGGGRWRHRRKRRRKKRRRGNELGRGGERHIPLSSFSSSSPPPYHLLLLSPFSCLITSTRRLKQERNAAPLFH